MANSFINKKADLTTTDLTTLYTVPSFKTSVVKSILVSDDSGGGGGGSPGSSGPGGSDEMGSFRYGGRASYSGGGLASLYR